MFTRRIAVAAVAASALVMVAPTSASATPTPPTTTLLSNHVVAPYNLAITKSKLYVADGGLNALARVRADGTLKTIANGPAGEGSEVAGVAVSKRGGYIAYTTTEHPGEEENVNGALHIRDKYGATKTVSTFAYENRVNSDQGNTYGPTNPNLNQCVKDALTANHASTIPYAGIKDSHPFSVAAYGKNSWLVADAAGNDILKVNRKGHVSTVAVLPPQPVTFTPEIVHSLHLPGCVTGLTYNFEPVPTDVEVGANGFLYVSTLSGSPLNGGSVYRVNPRNGHSKLVATGFAGATNLALFKGKIYVTELFAGDISVIKNGAPSPFLALPGALSVEAGRGHLYAGTGVAGPSLIVKIVKGKASPVS